MKTLMLLCALLVAAPGVQAQAKKKKAGEDNFADKVWLGAAINNNLQFGGGAFSFGLSPMAGYEPVPHLKIGPFVRLDYHHERLTFTRPYYTYSSFDVGPGVFTRVDVLRRAFAQLEYEHAFIQIPKTDEFGDVVFDSKMRALKETEVQHYVYVGAGWSSGTDAVQYGISIHYNVLDDPNHIRYPWDYRISILARL